VRVEAGTDLSGVDIAAMNVAPEFVSGEVWFEGAGVTTDVILRVERLDLRRGTSRIVRMHADRSFTATGIAPGRYAVAARIRRF
jgi:hypothetical protein